MERLRNKSFLSLILIFSFLLFVLFFTGCVTWTKIVFCQTPYGFTITMSEIEKIDGEGEINLYYYPLPHTLFYTSKFKVEIHTINRASELLKKGLKYLAEEFKPREFVPVFVRFFLYRREFKKAISAIREGKQQISNYPLWDVLLAYVYELSNQHEEAMKIIEEIKEPDEERFDFHFILSDIYFHAKDFERARCEALMAQQRAPERFEGYLLLGEIYLAQGRLEEAIKEYHQAVKLAPKNFESKYRLGIAYWASGRRREAVRVIREAKRIASDRIEPYVFFGERFIEENQIKKARRELRRGLKRCCLFAFSNQRFIELVIKVGLFKEAERYLLSRVKDENNTGVGFCLGKLYYLGSNFKEAKRWLKLVLKKEPGGIISIEAKKMLRNLEEYRKSE